MKDSLSLKMGLVILNPTETAMTEEERREILAKLRASVDEAKRLTPAQARDRLKDEGFCDAKGRLSPAYGGRSAARG